MAKKFSKLRAQMSPKARAERERKYRRLRAVLRLAPIHPGESLKAALDDAQLPVNAVALALHIPANRLREIINGKRSITAETALRLARFFGTSPQFWMNLDYELQVAEDAAAEKIEREVE